MDERMKDLKLTCVVAHDGAQGIAKDGQIPWHIPEDLNHFAQLTRGPFTSYGKALSDAPLNAVIMGRKTWESLPDKSRPLPVRINIVLTNQCKHIAYNGDAMVCGSVDDVLSLLRWLEHSEAFIIGGEDVYRLFLPYVSTIHVSRVTGDFGCDRFFPDYMNAFNLQEKQTADIEGHGPLTWEVWVRRDGFQCGR